MDMAKLGVRVDLSHTYRQAIEVAYEKYKKAGVIDNDLAKECEYIISRPEDPPFDESELYVSLPPINIPGMSYSKGGMNDRQSYEKFRLDMQRREDASLAALQEKFKVMKGEMDASCPGLCDKMSGVDVDDQLNIKVFAQPGALSAEEEATLNGWFNGAGDFRKLMLDHHQNLLGLLEE